MAWNKINNYIYFYHLEKFCVLPDCPENVTDAMASEFASTNALARTAPVFSYQHSGPRTMSVNLEFHRDMMNDLNRNVSNLKDNVVDFSGDDYVDTLIKYLQAIALPKYNEYSSGSKTVIPPMIAVRFENNIFIKGVVTSGIQVTYKKPILIDGKYAVIDVSFTVSEVEPYDADYVVEAGSFRGLTRTFKNGIYADTDDSPTITVKNNGSTASKISTANTVNVSTIDRKHGTSVKLSKRKSPDISTTGGGGGGKVLQEVS